MPWNKGYTKYTHLSVRKISQTMKEKKIDNFKKWRDEQKSLGNIKSVYPKLKKDGNLAELIGVTLGDGHVYRFARTESLRIISNANNAGFVQRYTEIIERVFGKTPTAKKRKSSEAVDIRIYEKFISKRMNLPCGARGDLDYRTPSWITKNKEYIRRFLRGLYEAEGCFCIHKPTYTYKFIFCNTNPALLREVKRLLEELGYHPHQSPKQVQISKKAEVYAIKEELQFRQY